jgi:hypothetical protein
MRTDNIFPYTLLHETKNSQKVLYEAVFDDKSWIVYLEVYWILSAKCKVSGHNLISTDKDKIWEAIRSFIARNPRP